mgnify:CR=1 FL=1
MRNYFWVTIWYKHYDEEFAISVRKSCFLKQIFFYPSNLKFQGIKHHCHKRNLFCETKFLLESVPYFFYCFFLFLSYFFFFLALCMSQKSPYIVTHYIKWVNTSWTYSSWFCNGMNIVSYCQSFGTKKFSNDFHYKENFAVLMVHILDGFQK